jgi:hypothetical protein
MPPSRDAAFPVEAARDLLGIVRALYTAWKAARRPVDELAELESIGRELAGALTLARRSPVPSLGHSAAWAKADAAAQRLGEIIGADVPLRPALLAASARVRSGAGPPRTPSEARKLKNRSRQ